MKNEYLSAKDALAMMKSGCHLEARIEGKTEDFYFSEDSVYVLSENKVLKISEYRFLELYEKTVFFLSEEQNEEEVADPRKDEEYYSWRQ